jgi:hypothetical protein
MTLDTFGPNQKQLGAILFNKCVSGCRALDPKETKEVSGIKFQSYGSHYDNYPNPYLTVACAIGSEGIFAALFRSRELTNFVLCYLLVSKV